MLMSEMIKQINHCKLDVANQYLSSNLDLVFIFFIWIISDIKRLL